MSVPVTSLRLSLCVSIDLSIVSNFAAIFASLEKLERQKTEK